MVGELQWGRTFLRAEIMCGQRRTKMIAKLQWGRTFLRAEIRRDRGRAATGQCFNGAARFCVRK